MTHRVGRLLLSVLAVLMVAVGAGEAFAAAPPADVSRLRDGLPPEFRRPTILVYPVLDLRPLPYQTPSAASAGPPGAGLFEDFVKALATYENLRIVTPDKTVARVKSHKAWAERERVALIKAAEGIEEYQQVKLEAALRHLRQATDLYADLEYQYVDPKAVAKAELTRGLALLENGDAVDANVAFTRALQVDPRLRLSEKYDRPESIAAFERARTGLVESLASPGDFPPWPTGEPQATDVFVLRSRIVPARDGSPERLEVAVVASGGAVVPDRQDADVPDAANRLASRVWACLPFGRGVRARRNESEIRLDAGFTWFVFADNGLGTGIFNNVGAQAAFSWTVAQHIGLQTTFLVANSGRDEQEDLRADILTVRGFIGPGYENRVGPWRFDVHLGVDVASPGRTISTDNVYCKYFGRGPLCPASDLDSTPRTLLVGAGLTASGSFDLVDDLYLAMHVWAAEYFFELDEADLGRPVGTSLALGYRFR